MLGDTKGTSLQIHSDHNFAIILGYARCFPSLAGEASDSDTTSSVVEQPVTSQVNSKVTLFISYSTGKSLCKPILYFSPLIPIQ